MSQATPPELNPPPVAKRRIVKILTCIVLCGLLVFIAMSAQTLWAEWSLLGRQRSQVRATTIIGYRGISPRLSQAQRPDEWFRVEKDQTFLWAGWKHGVGHVWFRVASGDVDRGRISAPMGREVIPTIDVPLIENADGPIGKSIPDETPVVGLQFAGIHSVYPVLILEKVLVVNDSIADQPFLVLNNPLADAPEKTVVYQPKIDVHRLTMSFSGFALDKRPVFFDRETESLWVQADQALLAISGKHKGQRLPEIARLAPLTWTRWRSAHPGSRLLVGANRDPTPPKL